MRKMSIQDREWYVKRCHSLQKELPNLTKKQISERLGVNYATLLTYLKQFKEKYGEEECIQR